MRKEEFKTLSVKDLEERVIQEREQYRKLRFSHKVSPLENPMRLRIARRSIAQTLTELKERTMQKAAQKTDAPQGATKDETATKENT